jgi:hypothetical protein
MNIPVKVVCMSNSISVVLEFDIDGIKIQTAEIKLKHPGGHKTDKPSYIQNKVLNAAFVLSLNTYLSSGSGSDLWIA